MASMGFQAMALVLRFMTTLRSGPTSLESYKMILLSLAAAPSRWTSTGENLM